MTYLLNVKKVELAALNLGLCEKQLLSNAGCAHDILTKARHGKRVSAKTVYKLAAAVGCEPVELIREEAIPNVED